MKLLIVFFIAISSTVAWGNSSPLKPVRLDNPRATMRSYFEAMNDYNLGRTTHNPELEERIQDATRAFDLSYLPPLVRKDRGRELAILLKEVIDRVIKIDFAKIPDDSSLVSWRLKDTEITIRKFKDGPRAGDFLFSQDTLERVPEFYKRVKALGYVSKIQQGAGYKQAFQEKWLPDWAQDNFWGLKKIQWIGLFVGILFGLMLKVLTEFINNILIKLTNYPPQSLRHQLLLALKKPLGLLVASGFWYFGIIALDFEGLSLAILINSTQVVFSVSLVWAAYKLTDIFTALLKRVTARTASELDAQLVPLLGKSLRVFVVVIGALITIQNLGFNVMSLLAGLGLGGLAFALAAKDTAANFFGSIMILIDQPFNVGDWIITNKAEGTVEEIGFRSTRLRTFYDSLVSVPNSQIANENIDNMGKRKFRRTRAQIGLTYGTSPEKMQAFVEGVRNILLANPNVNNDKINVSFVEYGDFSLNILLYYFLECPDWSSELVQKQNINIEIYRLANEIDVEFAFPTQSLVVEQFPEKKPLREEKTFSLAELKKKTQSFGPKGSVASLDERKF